MNNTSYTIQSSFPILGVKALQTFGALKQIAVLSCLLAVAGAPLTLWAGKPPPLPTYAYSLRQLSLPAGASTFGANGLNNAGQAVGEADFPNYEWVGCLWQTNGQTVQLPLLPSAQVRRASAGSITDSGLLIAGSSVIYLNTNNLNAFSFDGQRATFWENTNTATGFQARDWNDLMPPELGIHLIGGKVSSDGLYVVLSGPDRQTGAAVATVIANVVYDANGSITGINVLDVLDNTQPQAINSDGAGVVRVLGVVTTGGSPFPFLWKQTASGEISRLLAPYSDSAAQNIGGVNKFGQVADTYSGEALRWEETALWDLGLATDLGGLGGSSATSRDINDAGVVVGSATLAGKTAPQCAFISIFPNGPMTDLNTLAPVGNLVLQGANRINNSGQILAYGTQSHSTASIAVLLTPVNP